MFHNTVRCMLTHIYFSQQSRDRAQSSVYEDGNYSLENAAQISLKVDDSQMHKFYSVLNASVKL